MDVRAMSAFFAVLALAALGLGLAALGSALWSRERAGTAELAAVAPLVAACIAAVAMAGSLYYSESAGFEPCELCWYQRIAMYSLAAILAIAAVRREQLTPYVLVLSGAGLLISVYHYQLEWFPDQGSTCEIDNPCSVRIVEEFGFVSLPFMAGCGFLAIAALTVLQHTMAKEP
jgi:disulfide bond formation protein DsbB